MAFRQPTATSIISLPSERQQARDGPVKTSIDLANDGKFKTTPLAGQKRVVNDAGTRSHVIQPSSTIHHTHLRPSAIRSLSSSSSPRSCPAYQPGSTPSLSQNPLLSLRHGRYDLPDRLVSNLAGLGINSIYPWQSACLLQSGVLTKGANLVYTAPTGGGKSLVADIALLRATIKQPTRKKAIIIVPYVALVQEKSKWLRRVVDGLVRDETSDEIDTVTQILRDRSHSRDILIAPFYGGSKTKATWHDCDIAVCTIEKANSLINAAIEDGVITELGLVVADELHMLDDPSRGYVYELLLIKLLSLPTPVQIVGMSATLSNPQLLADWLKAKYFVAKYKPIPVYEHLVYDNAIYSTASGSDFLQTASQLSSSQITQKPRTPLRLIDPSPFPELKNNVANAVVALATEAAAHGHGALVFVNSRAGAQSLATLIAASLEGITIDTVVSDQRRDTLATLQALTGGYELCLNATIPVGVGFHHAGLTAEERDILANAYDQGRLKILVATCSLAAGINLPARRVILRGAKMGRDMVGPALLRQMRGRAGRKGKDEVGETYLCCEKEELEPVAELLERELPPVSSCLLTTDQRKLTRAILEAISIRLTSSYAGFVQYVQNSLLWQLEQHEKILDALNSSLISLLEQKLIVAVTEQVYAPTALGAAIVAAGLTPEDGSFVHADLRQALTAFVMDSELHIFYLFTPIPQPTPEIRMTADISWSVFRDCLESLDDASLRVLRLVGVSPVRVQQLVNAGRDSLPETTVDEQNTARIYRRIYSTFILRDICNEMSISAVSLKYNLPRGTVQNIAQTCHGFAAGMIKFCQRMATPYQSVNTGPEMPPIASDAQSSGFSMLAVVLEHMQTRLYAGARADLLELAQVTFVKGRMARVLFEAGLKSVRMLSEADPKKDILPILMLMSKHKLRQIAGEVRQEGKSRDDGKNQDQLRTELEEAYDLRRQKLEDKLLQKAEVMVRSASTIWEREVLRQGDFEEI